jgi:hypothetical protein
MSFGNFSGDEFVVLKPPSAKSMARQETKRLMFVTALVFALVGVCAVATANLNLNISADFVLGLASFLPQVF